MPTALVRPLTDSEHELDSLALVDILSKQELRVLSKTTINNGVRESLMEKLTLRMYIITKGEQCLRNHKNYSKCNSFVSASKCVVENKFVHLPCLWNKYFNGKYDSGKAQRKVLQMPVATISVNGKLFIVEKDYECNNTMI
jgi:hypothetical protein